ncbi:hypothetical protein [Azotosporobacter soli]
MDTSILLATGATTVLYTLSRMLFWKGVAAEPSTPAYWNRQYLKY